MTTASSNPPPPAGSIRRKLVALLSCLALGIRPGRRVGGGFAVPTTPSVPIRTPALTSGAGSHPGPGSPEPTRSSASRPRSDVGSRSITSTTGGTRTSPATTRPGPSPRAVSPFLNWKAQRTDGQAIAWRTIASGAQDAAIAARADAIAAFGMPGARHVPPRARGRSGDLGHARGVRRGVPARGWRSSARVAWTTSRSSGR